MKLPVQIHKETGIPLYVQLEEQIRHLVHNGTLAAGQLMPTVRALAVDLGINGNTVGRVYRDLQHDGVLVLRRGVGTFVAAESRISPFSKRDRVSLERKVDALIEIGLAMKMTSVELFQLIETRWKEVSDVHR